MSLDLLTKKAPFLMDMGSDDVDEEEELGPESGLGDDDEISTEEDGEEEFM